MPVEPDLVEEETPEVILTGEALARSERRRKRREATQNLLSWGLGESEDDDDENTNQLLGFLVKGLENNEGEEILTKADVQKNQIQTNLGEWVVRSRKKEKVEECKASSNEIRKVVRKEKKQGSILGWIRHDPTKSLTNLLISNADVGGREPRTNHKKDGAEGDVQPKEDNLSPFSSNVGVECKPIWPGVQVEGRVCKVVPEQTVLPGISKF